MTTRGVQTCTAGAIAEFAAALPDGAEAVSRLEEEVFDVLVTDVVIVGAGRLERGRLDYQRLERGWRLLGESHLFLGQSAESADAYAQAIEQLALQCVPGRCQGLARIAAEFLGDRRQ